ncbi:MAG: GntR family transcriptional regulator [Desulfobacterales bacterium]|jgi:DNA-binding GntR family transcriptional regulator
MDNLIKLEQPGTFQNQAYERIKNLLISGQLEFDEVYSANHFAEILGVSRTPIREALLQLTSEGFFVSLRGRGFKIKEFSKKEIQDFFEARKMIEAYVIEQLVEEVTEEDLKPLDDSLKQMINGQRTAGSYNFLEADKSFHMNLIYRYENSLLASIMGNIRDFISILGQKALASPGRVKEVIQEHQDILEALHQKDKTAAVRAIKYHLDATEKSLLENL